MTDIDYSKWFNKAEWSDIEALYILYGLDPELTHDAICWGEDPFGAPKAVLAIQEHDDFEGYGWIVNRINEIMHEIHLDHDFIQPKTPQQWIEFFSNEGLIAFSRKLLKSLPNERWSKPDTNSKIQKYYSEWAKKDAWNFDNVVALLCRDRILGSPIFLGALPGTRYDKDKVSKLLKESISNQGIEYIQVDCISHIERRFRPLTAIRWAESKGFYFPKLLLMHFGYTSEGKKKKKGKGIRDKIVDEFNKRVISKKLSVSWDDEVSYLCKFTQENGNPYDSKSMCNIIQLQDFNQGKLGIQKPIETF